MLGRFFKPNWQHAKAGKRIKAISKLSVEKAEDQSILSQLALTDQDDLVRLTATEKLINLDLLIKISKKDAAQNNREQALHRISQILLSKTESPSHDEKSAALSALFDSNFLTHIALNSPDETLRQQAVSQLDDDTCLSVIAEKSQRASIRVQATEKICTTDTLETLCKKAKSKDKGVFKTAKDKLQVIREQEKLVEENRAALDKTISAMRVLQTSEYFPLFGAKRNALVQEWDQLSAFATPQQEEDFASSAKQTLSVLEQQKQLEKLAAEQEAELLRQKEQCHSLYSELCVLKETSSQLFSGPSELEAFQTQLDKLINKWQLINQHSAESELEKFSKISTQLNSLIQSYKDFYVSEPQIVSLSESLAEHTTCSEKLKSQAKESRKLIAKIGWSKQHTKPDSLNRLESALSRAHQLLDKQNSHTKQLQNELGELLDELKLAIQNGEIRTADKQIKKAEQLSKRLNGSLTNELEQRIKTLGYELQEIRDWQAYAVTPKKEALCNQMEALIENDLGVQEKANHIKRLQKEWKLLDATDSVHSQQLWKRFKKASDSAYAPCDEFFAEQRNMRQENLREREKICDSLDLLSIPESDCDADDWKTFESKIRDAKQAWRTHSPVDRAPGKKLQARFDRQLSQLEEPIKAVRQDNAKKKQTLISAAAEILNTAHIEGSTEQIKQLQQEWKSLGQAPRNQERKLWNQFREICSAVFEKYYETPSHERSIDLDHQALSELCDELEQLIQSACSLSLLESKLQQARALLSKTSSSESKRVDAVVSFIEEQKHNLNNFESALDHQLQTKANICEQLEHAILEQAEEDQLEAIQHSWPQSDAEISSNINQRYKTLINLAAHPDQIDSILNEQELRLRQLCIRLEIASSQPSPTEDQALRMEYQMERLQQALAEQEQGFNLVEIRQLELEWLSIPFAGHFEELSERFEQQIQNLL